MLASRDRSQCRPMRSMSASLSGVSMKRMPALASAGGHGRACVRAGNQQEVGRGRGWPPRACAPSQRSAPLGGWLCARRMGNTWSLIWLVAADRGSTSTRPPNLVSASQIRGVVVLSIGWTRSTLSSLRVSMASSRSTKTLSPRHLIEDLRKLNGARLLQVYLHALIERPDEFGGGLVAHNGVAVVATGAEEIRGGHILGHGP